MRRCESVVEILRQEAVDAALVDIDGTLVSGDQAVGTARCFLQHLRETRTPFVCVSNDSSQTSASKADRLNELGLAIDAEEIVLCYEPFQEWVTTNGVSGPIQLVGFSRPEWMHTVLVPKRSGHAALSSDLQAIALGSSIEKLQEALESIVNFLRSNRHVPLIVPNPDAFYLGEDGELRTDAGGFARCIALLCSEVGVRIQVVYLGKPNRPIYRAAIKRLRQLYPDGHLAPKRVFVIGDSLTSDIRGGFQMGFRTVLVLGGVTLESDLPSAATVCAPEFVAERL